MFVLLLTIQLCHTPLPAKVYLNKKSFPEQKTIQNLVIDAQGFRKTKNEDPQGNGSYQPTSAGRSANRGQIGRHWLAGNFYFRSGRIFIFCFSEPLGINFEGLNSLLFGIQLFI